MEQQTLNYLKSVDIETVKLGVELMKAEEPPSNWIAILDTYINPRFKYTVKRITENLLNLEFDIIDRYPSFGGANTSGTYGYSSGYAAWSGNISPNITSTIAMSR